MHLMCTYFLEKNELNNLVFSFEICRKNVVDEA